MKSPVNYKASQQSIKLWNANCHDNEPWNLF